jgi:hypothetical protein
MEERWNQHVHGAHSYKKCITRKFWNAIRKYGSGCWDHECLMVCETHGEAKNMERKLIREHDTFNCGYNTTEGGEGLLGYKHSKETKEKLRVIGKSKRRSDVFKQNVKNHMRRIHLSRKYGEYLVHRPDGTTERIFNLKSYCFEHNLKLEVLRWTLKTGKPCPRVNQGWKVEYVCS